MLLALNISFQWWPLIKQGTNTVDDVMRQPYYRCSQLVQSVTSYSSSHQNKPFKMHRFSISRTIANWTHFSHARLTLSTSQKGSHVYHHRITVHGDIDTTISFSRQYCRRYVRIPRRRHLDSLTFSHISPSYTQARCTLTDANHTTRSVNQQTITRLV